MAAISRLKPSSLPTVARIANQERFNSDFILAGIKQKHIRKDIRILNDVNLSATSINRAFSSIRSFHNYLSGEEIIKSNPVLLLDTPKTPRKLPIVLSPQEIDTILDVVDVSKELGIRDLAVLEILYSGGLRVSELCDLKLTDILLDAEMLRVTGKGNKQRLVPLGSRAIKCLDQGIDLPICNSASAGGRGGPWHNRRPDCRGALCETAIHLVRFSAVGTDPTRGDY